MSRSSSGFGGLLKAGCLGCLGLAVVAAVIMAVLTGIAWRQAKHENIAERELSRTLGSAAGAEQDDLESAPPELDAEGAAGTVILDLSQTTFEIRPGIAGEPVRVSATYDTNSYALSERYGEAAGGGAWTYEVGFHRTSTSFLVAFLKELFSGSRPHVVIQLPPDLPFDLDLQAAQGGGEVELGGLWLTNADIVFRQGGGSVKFSEPLLQPIEHLSIDFAQGGGDIGRLGNASPRRLEISIAMGGGDVDLRGAWQRDAEIAVDVKMGGVSVRLPRNVAVRGIDRGGLRPPQSDEVPRPVLSFSSSSRFGEVEFLD